MTALYTQLIPALVCLISLCIPIPITLWIRHQRKNRRNPLTSQMLRASGESIGKRIEALNADLDLYFNMFCLVPLLCYSMYMSARYIGDSKSSPVVYVLTGIFFLALMGYRLATILKQRHNELLGLDCERSVGQELNQLMLDGCRVYHDFPADGFNIDHIVIGENGVFAIETKGRAKPDRGRGQEDVRVVYDGDKLHFPTWNEKQPLEQAKRQADWLTGWLTSAVGAQVAVKPALALPGWFVERKKGDFLIYNGKNPRFITTIRTESPLSPEMVQRVSHQIEQRCRDVEPLAYKKKSK
jgi:hypothetical protein